MSLCIHDNIFSHCATCAAMLEAIKPYPFCECVGQSCDAKPGTRCWLSGFEVPQTFIPSYGTSEVK